MFSEKLNKILVILRNGDHNNGTFVSIRNDQEIVQEIQNLTQFLEDHYPTPPLGQRLWSLRENLTETPMCPICGVLPLKFHRYSSGYFQTCGTKGCQQSSKSQKFTQTVNSQEFLESGKKEEWFRKQRETMIQKYGTPHNWSGELRKEWEKTMMDKWGTIHPLQNEDLKRKRKETTERRHGTTDMFSLEKTKNTIQEKWGSDNVMRNDEIKTRVSTSSKRTKNTQTLEKLTPYNIIMTSDRVDPYDLHCQTCGVDFQMSNTGLNVRLRSHKNPCPKCNPVSLTHSKGEKELVDFIRSIYSGEVLENDRTPFRGQSRFSEVDVHLPDLGICFEYNGLYYHGEHHKDKSYHIDKTRFLLNKGIKTYHIWEDDWLFNQDLVKSMVQNQIGRNRRIWGRSCEVVRVSGKDYRKFCDENHIQGYTPSTHIYGLSHEGELVSIMSFSKSRKMISSTDVGYELIRLCSKKGVSVVGGPSKMFKRFIQDQNPDVVLSYCDVSHSPDPESSVYSKMGFQYDGITDPGYHWVIDGKRENRLNWTKKKLVDLGHDPLMTEVEIMNSLGRYRIFNCGNFRFVWTP